MAATQATDAHPDAEQIEVQPLPREWAATGEKQPPTGNREAFYAVEVSDQPEEDRLLVRYATLEGEYTLVETFDRYETTDGQVVPACVVDEGPTAFPAIMAVYQNEIDARCRSGRGLADYRLIYNRHPAMWGGQ